MNLFNRGHGRPTKGASTINPLEDLWSQFLKLPTAIENRLPDAFTRPGTPALNVCEGAAGYLITLDAPGMKEDDFEILVMGNQLTISGERHPDEDQELLRVESHFGRFERSLTLPDNCQIDPDAVVAKYDCGVLALTIPKVQPKASHRVKVQST